MKDVLTYQTPYGIFGKMFDLLFLKKHLIQFLKTRNNALKKELETHSS